MVKVGRSGFIYFVLPKYCSEMNPIELEWQHIKEDELAGQMFDDELELAYAVIDGVEVRENRSWEASCCFNFGHFRRCTLRLRL